MLKIEYRSNYLIKSISQIDYQDALLKVHNFIKT